jgi:hypothetical protein
MAHMAGRDQAAHTVLATHATLADVLARQDDLQSYLAVVEDEVTVARHALGPDPVTSGTACTRRARAGSNTPAPATTRATYTPPAPSAAHCARPGR